MISWRRLNSTMLTKEFSLITIETALESNRGRIAFAALWAAILAACWNSIQASPPFQALVNHGKQLNWALATLYTTALYLAILTLLLWLGLAFCLIIIHGFNLRSLARGLAAMSFVLFVAMGIESFIRGEQLSLVAEYILRWFPMFVSVYAGCRLAVPRKSGEFFSHAAGKS
jgi:hypothetical protein